MMKTYSSSKAPVKLVIFYLFTAGFAMFIIYKKFDVSEQEIPVIFLSQSIFFFRLKLYI